LVTLCAAGIIKRGYGRIGILDIERLHKVAESGFGSVAVESS
jgi:hypothetical protein